MAEAKVAGVRRYETVAEIEQEQGFIRSQPITLLSYGFLLGWYKFERDELTCCVQRRPGVLCSKRHKYGWVARLKDGSATIIGHECAEEKFGADSKVAGDISRALNEIGRLDLDERIRHLLGDRATRVEEIDRTIADLRGAQERLADLRGRFGASVWARLEKMAKAGTGRVVVVGFTPAEVSQDGEITRSAKRIPLAVGTFNGIRACNLHLLAGHIQLLQRQRKLYSIAIDSGRSAVVTKAQRDFRASLSEHERLIREAQKLLADALTFESNDFIPLIFLTQDRGERYRLIRLAFSMAGRDLGKDAAKSWIAGYEARLCAKSDVKTLKVQ